jgi:transcriptional regulator with XRE-family HTH domain
MDDLRKKFIQLRERTGFSQSDFEGIVSRSTVARFEAGGDITFSKLSAAVRKMKGKLTILI